MRDHPETASNPIGALRLLAAAIAALVLASALGPLPALATEAAGAAAATQTYVVPADEPLSAGARVVSRLEVVDALLVEATTPPPGAVQVDVPLDFSSLGHADAKGNRVDSGVRSTGAEDVWAEGNRGDGAVVALVDSGVGDVPALDGAVVAQLDFSGTGGGDPLGHGTFMASLIAGRGPDVPGVAPKADILSLKVGDRQGETTLGTVLTALDWLYSRGRELGVRIAVLALGIDADTPPAVLLDAAVQRLAQADVLVVTAAGNDGPGRLTAPATAPGSFSVGAFDDAAQSDGGPVPADFSSTGKDRVRVDQPDALAAGVSLVGHVPEDSIIGREHADTREGTLLRGTGTSMSTALAAGVAALASAERPDLGGGALEEALRNDAGVIDAPDAVDTIAEAPVERGRPVPPGQAKKGAGHPGKGNPGKGNGAVGWKNLRWKNLRWKNVRWTNLRWKSDDWANLRWKGGSWANLRWKTNDWANLRWKAEGWANLRWKADEWNNLRWKAQGWKGGDGFAGARWANLRWKTTRWALLEAP